MSGPVTPLRNLRLGNFKSVRDTKVELRPLTAIVGRNSSGKSTLLQGILALAQAVRREVLTQTFPLNGDFVRLGTFDEVRNFDADENTGIDIGFTAQIDYRSWGMVRGSEQGTANATVEWNAHLVPQIDDSESGQAVLDTVEFSVRSHSEDNSATNVVLEVSEIRGPAQHSVPNDRPARLFGRQGTEFDIDGRITDMRSGQSSQIDLMSMAGGLPVRVYKYDQRFNVLFRLWWELAFHSLEEDRHAARRATAEGLDNSETRDGTLEELRKDVNWAVRFAKDCITSEETDHRESAATWRRLTQLRRFSMHGPDQARFEYRIERLKPRARRRLANAMNELGERKFGDRVRDALLKAKVNWLEEKVRDEPTTDVYQILEQATLETYALFQQVRYLGPLRAKAQVVYSPGVGQIDLGPEGQFAAAYLHANSAQQVLVPLPDGGARMMPLGEGLNLWLEELGLADGAMTRDRGRLGIGLEVKPVGRQQSVDLTSVGVGVSQALPVVLLCLLATPGSIVLIEQPELHLHPAMQLKLADFLLASAKTGRQIVFETHSEHVINRLRFHVVADEAFETANVVRLLFAEQERGETVYRISDINEVGGLSIDWPKGFLDVAADESTRLLQQSLTKVRARPVEES